MTDQNPDYLNLKVKSQVICIELIDFFKGWRGSIL